MSDIDIKECEKCVHFFIGDEMGELHNRYPMCEKSQRNVIWNMDKCPKPCDKSLEEHDKQIRADEREKVLDLIDRHLWNYSKEVWTDFQSVLEQLKNQK